MLFEEAETSNLKTWLVKRLEDISDADSDVLADYVLALIKTDDPADQVKENCLENLRDFLADNTDKFVDDVFASLEKKSYRPGYVEPKVSHKLTATAPSFNPPSGQSGPFNGAANPNGFAANGQGDQSRKRTYNDHTGTEPSDQRDTHYGRGNGDRAIKQSRRGGHDGRGRGRGGFMGGNGQHGAFQQPQMPQMPTLPPGFPPLDPMDPMSPLHNPMSAILAMQAMGFPPLPGFPTFPGPTASPGQSASPSDFAMEKPSAPPARSRGRCRDYDNKGYCARGGTCPYEHGADKITMTDIPGTSSEYDPRTATLSPDLTVPQSSSPFETSRPQRGNAMGRGRGFNRGGRGHHGNQRDGRSTFSSTAPNTDTSITSVVVEKIPDEKFNEASIREFFSDFGTIEEISLQGGYKRVAIVKYQEYGSAKKAYDSPKVIFDNRFVKVYWYTPEVAEEMPKEKPKEPEDEEMIDPVEFAQKQAEAQRAHEEKARKLKEAETAREELEKKIKAQAEERKKLMEKLSAKASSATQTTPATNGNSTAAVANAGSPTSTSATPVPAKSTSQTEALRAKLAELEAEAENLGLAPEEVAPYALYRGRGSYNPYMRGGYRGRAGARGGWRGIGATPVGGVARLDNRPRSVDVKAVDGVVDFGDERVKLALRAYLSGIGEFASITPQPPKPTTSSDQPPSTSSFPSAVVAFNERYVAEIFMNTSSTIPEIGAVTFSWVANTNPAATTATPSATSTPAAVGAVAAGAPKLNPMASAFVAGVANGGGSNGAEAGKEGGGADKEMADYDVAEDEDEDRWMR